MGFPLETPDNTPVVENDSNPVQDNSPGINPAWNEVLGIIPPDLHSQITPHLQKWDTGVQQRFQQVHSQYEPYKPLVDQGISPDDLRMGYGLMQAVYNKPLEVVQAIKENFPDIDFGSILAQQGDADLVNPIADPNAQYAQLPPHIAQQIMQQQQQLEIMGKILLGQREQTLAQQQEEQLDTVITGLKDKYGEFPEDVVLSMALNMGDDIEGAVKRFQQITQQALTAANKPSPPRLLGSGAGPIPETNTNPANSSSKEVINYVASLLKGNAVNQ